MYSLTPRFGNIHCDLELKPWLGAIWRVMKNFRGEFSESGARVPWEKVQFNPSKEFVDNPLV